MPTAKLASDRLKVRHCQGFRFLVDAGISKVSCCAVWRVMWGQMRCMLLGKAVCCPDSQKISLHRSRMRLSLKEHPQSPNKPPICETSYMTQEPWGHLKCMPTGDPFSVETLANNGANRDLSISSSKVL